MADLTIDVRRDVAAGNLVDQEQAKKSVGAARNFRLEIDDGQLIDAGGTLNRLLRIDGAYAHVDDSQAERGADDEGTLTATLHFQSVEDAVQAQDIECVVRSAQATFP